MTTLGKVRKTLETRADDALDAIGVGNAEVYVGSRQIKFSEREPPFWEMGVAISLPKGFDDALDDFDELMAGRHQLKDLIEADRTLGGLVMDCAVTSIRGPQRGPEQTLVEWIVNIRAEE